LAETVALEHRRKRGQAELYLLGLLSLMDAILEVPIGVVIEDDHGMRVDGGLPFGNRPFDSARRTHGQEVLSVPLPL